MKNNLNDMGLQSLRIYARKIGVKSPTIYTRENLIEKIRMVENGATKPYFCKRGRPSKNQYIFDMENVNEIENNCNKRIMAVIELTKKFLEDLNKLLK